MLGWGTFKNQEKLFQGMEMESWPSMLHGRYIILNANLDFDFFKFIGNLRI